MSEHKYKATTFAGPILGKVGSDHDGVDIGQHLASKKADKKDRPPLKTMNKGQFWAGMRAYSSNTASITGQPARDKKPIIPAEDINEDILQRELYKYGIVHDELVFLSQIRIPDTPPNREFSYKISDTAQVITRMVQMTIVGDGIFIESDIPEIKTALEDDFFMNIKGPLDDYNISDLTHDVLRDGMNHGYHVSAVLSNKFIPVEEAYGLDMDPVDLFSDDKAPQDSPVIGSKAIQVHRLDMRTIQKATHPTTGAKKFIQEVVGPSDLVTKTEFFSKDFNPTMKTIYGLTTDIDNSKIYRINLTPDKVLYVDLFREPPMASIMDLIAHRSWLLWAQKKVGLKFAGDVPVVKVGTDEDHTEDLNTRLEELTAVSEYLADMRFGDAIALDFNMEWVNNKNVGGNVGFQFAAVINELDKKIALALGSSMALFEASGAELATSRTIQDTFLRWIAGIRTKLDRAYKILCYRYLSARGIKFNKQSLSIKWTPLRERVMGEVINSIRNMWDSGMLTDMEEGRNMAKGIFDFESLEDDENKSYMDVIYDKAYSDAKARMDATIEGQKELNALDLAHQKSLKAAGIIATSTTSGSSGSSSPSSGKSTKKTEENKQGSTAGNIQAGDRKSGPQKDGGNASQSSTEREEQAGGKA